MPSNFDFLRECYNLNAMKNLSILGSTGSIGCNALKIVEMFPDRFSVKALAAKNNTTLLASQVERFSPEIVVVFDETRALELKACFPRRPVLK